MNMIFIFTSLLFFAGGLLYYSNKKKQPMFYWDKGSKDFTKEAKVNPDSKARSPKKYTQFNGFIISAMGIVLVLLDTLLSYITPWLWIVAVVEILTFMILISINILDFKKGRRNAFLWFFGINVIIIGSISVIITLLDKAWGFA